MLKKLVQLSSFSKLVDTFHILNSLYPESPEIRLHSFIHSQHSSEKKNDKITEIQDVKYGLVLPFKKRPPVFSPYIHPVVTFIFICYQICSKCHFFFFLHKKYVLIEFEVV